MSAVNYINATDVRKDFSATIDNTVHCKPQFIRCTHNHMIFIEEGEFSRLLSVVTIPVQFIREDDGTYIVANPVIEDVFSTGATREEALDNMCRELVGYAQDYYACYELYSRAPNRRDHLPYIMRILSSSSTQAVKEMLDAETERP